MAINNIQIAINVNGNIDAVNGNLGPVNGNLGAMKKEQIAVKISILLFLDKNSKLLFFSIKCLMYFHLFPIYCVLQNSLSQIYSIFLCCLRGQQRT